MQYEGHNLRHELKYYISMPTYYELRERLQKILYPDENMLDENGYIISSLYFDDIYHSALEQKLAGIRFRKKFRIRCYDMSDSLIRLECKSKFDDLIGKESAEISRAEYDSILEGDYTFLLSRNERVCQELFCYNRTKLLKPEMVVEYKREAYVYPPGNVRITFDKNISVSVANPDMFAEDYRTESIFSDNIMVLEVKYDDYIPTVILQILRTVSAERCAISKYVMCRQKNAEENLL